MNQEFDLNRFKKAQELDYQTALKEVRQGRKRSHWIWYIFPQVKGLGYSGMSDYYGLDGLAEAKAYINDPVLKGRLLEISQALLDLDTCDASAVFGYPDDLKVCSCMTLFALADPKDAVFQDVLGKFYGGRADQNTLRILGLRGE